MVAQVMRCVAAHPRYAKLSETRGCGFLPYSSWARVL